MSAPEDCLKCLQNQDWDNLNKILSDNEMSRQLAESPTFSIFQDNFISELKRYEKDSDEDLFPVAVRIWHIQQQKDAPFKFPQSNLVTVAKYLFDKDPQKSYAEVLLDDPKAKTFLENHKEINKAEIAKNMLAAKLKIKVGEHGKLAFDKEIFNYPQEKELFIAARKVLPKFILLPNTALSTIIHSGIKELLNTKTALFFSESTLNLCVVNPHSYRPELFIELDKSWYKKANNVEHDKMKDKIFEMAGLKLYRLKKKENKDMTEIFELFIARELKI